jgi:hypothetical protein
MSLNPNYILKRYFVKKCWIIVGKKSQKQNQSTLKMIKMKSKSAMKWNLRECENWWKMMVSESIALWNTYWALYVNAHVFVFVSSYKCTLPFSSMGGHSDNPCIKLSPVLNWVHMLTPSCSPSFGFSWHSPGPKMHWLSIFNWRNVHYDFNLEIQFCTVHTLKFLFLNGLTSIIRCHQSNYNLAYFCYYKEILVFRYDFLFPSGMMRE